MSGLIASVAAVPVCPVTHSTLNWIAIAIFGACALLLVVSVASSWLQHRAILDRSPQRRSPLPAPLDLEHGQRARRGGREAGETGLRPTGRKRW